MVRVAKSLLMQCSCAKLLQPLTSREVSALLSQYSVISAVQPLTSREVRSLAENCRLVNAVQPTRSSAPARDFPLTAICVTRISAPTTLHVIPAHVAGSSGRYAGFNCCPLVRVPSADVWLRKVCSLV